MLVFLFVIAGCQSPNVAQSRKSESRSELRSEVAKPIPSQRTSPRSDGREREIQEAMAGLLYDSGSATVDPVVAPLIIPHPDPSQVDMEIASGRTALERGSLADGIRAMTHAVLHDPSRSEGLSGLSHGLALAGRAEEAAGACRAALARAPGDSTIQARLGGLLQGLGEFDAAAETWREVLRIDDSHPTARGRLAVVLYYLDRFDEAWAVIQEADAREQDVPPQLRVMLTVDAPEP